MRQLFFWEYNHTKRQGHIKYDIWIDKTVLYYPRVPWPSPLVAIWCPNRAMIMAVLATQSEVTED